MDLSSQSSMAETPTKKGFFDFLHLPAEIRLKVYEEVFASQDFEGRSPHRTYDSSLVANGVIASLVNPAGSELAMVNKQMHDESLPVLYKIHLFSLSVWQDFDDVDEDRRHFSTTEQLLTQLVRPSAPRCLSMITHLNLFLDVFEDSYKESRDAIVRQISTSCTKLKTFRLEMEGVPQDWIFSHEDFKLEHQTCYKCEAKTLESLRALASRVREFELVSMYGKEESQFKDFMESLFPGQHYVRIDGEYRITWTSEIPGKVRSLAFFR